ncbi:mitogen activated protein kinase, partial [Conglomerata obtusa]
MNAQTPFLYIFKSSSRYQFRKPLGKGAYGFVCSAYDTQSKKEIAIKRISNLNNSLVVLRTLREIKLLKHFRNKENIINIYNAVLPETKDFYEIFFIQECMEADLHYIIYSKQTLTIDHVKYLVYQIINGLNVIHKAGVLHRDLKPSNCLVNSRCVLKICDFGLARENVGEEVEMSNYVQTRWYRAPEILFQNQNYDVGVDIWSVGCIFAEIMLREPFIRGKNSADQILKMFKILGTPTKDILNTIKSEDMKHMTLNMKKYDECNFNSKFPTLSNNGIDLLTGLLKYDTSKRLTAEEAMRHPFLKKYAK